MEEKDVKGFESAWTSEAVSHLGPKRGYRALPRGTAAKALKDSQ